MSGGHVPRALGLEAASAASRWSGLKRALDAENAVVDRSRLQPALRAGAYPGAWFATRGRLPAALGSCQRPVPSVLTSPDGRLAQPGGV